jgi:hypothetical protein
LRSSGLSPVLFNPMVGGSAGRRLPAPRRTTKGLSESRGTGDDGTVEVLAELGEDRLDTADCLA